MYPFVPPMHSSVPSIVVTSLPCFAEIIFKFSSSDFTRQFVIRPLPYFSFLPDVYSRCPDGYTLFIGRCFILKLQGRKFDVAEAECNKLPRGHLGAIRSTEDFEFLKELRFVCKQHVTNHSFYLEML